MGWVLVGLGALIVFASFIQIQRLGSIRRWPRAMAEITRCDYETEDSVLFQVRVQYRFWLNGEEVVGDRLDLRSPQPRDLEACHALMSRLRVGSKHPVFYRKADPTDNVLERRLDPRAGISCAYAVAAGVVLTGIGLLNVPLQ